MDILLQFFKDLVIEEVVCIFVDYTHHMSSISIPFKLINKALVVVHVRIVWDFVKNWR